ncbi:MAG: L-histidine N(alpha)-methyltransferase, partial [Acidobacteriota bacterium]
WNTQYSYKYTPGEFRELASSCGFNRIDFWTDSDDLMSVQLFRR